MAARYRLLVYGLAAFGGLVLLVLALVGALAVYGTLHRDNTQSVPQPVYVQPMGPSAHPVVDAVQQGNDMAAQAARQDDQYRQEQNDYLATQTAGTSYQVQQDQNVMATQVAGSFAKPVKPGCPNRAFAPPPGC